MSSVLGSLQNDVLKWIKVGEMKRISNQVPRELRAQNQLLTRFLNSVLAQGRPLGKAWT